MRDFKNMKRQRGRNRSGGNTGGGRPQQNANRAFESNGPDNIKIRGHAQHVFEKYQQLARDAFSSGDRVLAENYLQHADHYFRLLRTIQPNRPASEILGRDTVASGLDIDFEEEFEAQPEDTGGDGMDGGDGQPGFEPRQDAPRQDMSRYDRQDRYDGGRNDGGRQDGARNDSGWRDRPDRDRQDNRPDNRQDNRVGFDRPDRGYNDRQDRNRPYNDRQQDGERGGRYDGRRDNRRFDGPREDRNGQREGREPRFDARPDGFAEGPQPSLRDASDTTPVSAASGAPAPSATEPSPMLRSQDGGVSEAPAFLQPSGGEAEETRPRARRRRAPRTFQPGEDAAEFEGPAPAEEV